MSDLHEGGSEDQFDLMTASRQEIFDQSVGKVLAQGKAAMIKKARHQNFVCQYYSPADGSRCAAGWLFDEDTARTLPNCRFSELDQTAGLEWLSGMSVDDIDLIGDLQEAHDNSAVEGPDVSAGPNKTDDKVFIKLFELKAKSIARAFGLKWNF